LWKEGNKKPTHIASTFYFLPTHQVNAEKNKKSLQSPTQEKNFKFFSPTLKEKIKTPDTQANDNADKQ